ncbi:MULTISPECIES: DUF992 domain-containing protein [Rhodopseudomonas]|uniref:DUF992 domain-containing protein n=1 Tax=Rhodopseudomonas palustris TaxID=1076 RepID=A0A0D7F8T5_RHOPL|nr:MULTISPECIES: DUF992 domain-containing protein [Rhodopseudomonas]KIZ48137.1 hypothetical protein OO17_00525 [Rhodopseudomonas palustris]MDF3814137.1 DUF992 domain-containing protein [Rhodopseudomonas sp. BAL398]WOK15520.1 DUF992 domain-containing protein [Rhodopseudomonas sp. BAL398]
MQFPRLFGIAAATLIASFVSAHAQARLQVGTLECEGGRNVGFVVGSQTELQCVFHSEGRRADPYVASIHRVGLDLGFTENTGMAWAVYAPTNRIGRGDLAGSFGGVGANASVGVGFGGNLLVGGSQNAYSLQPLSLQGQTGLNVTAGIADLQLRPVDLRTPRHYKHHKRHYRSHRGHRSHR